MNSIFVPVGTDHDINILAGCVWVGGGGGGGGELEDGKMLTANTHFSIESASCPAYGFSEHICSTHNKPTCNNLYY